MNALAPRSRASTTLTEPPPGWAKNCGGPIDDAVATVRNDVRDRAPPSTFRNDIDRATTAIAAAFDIPKPRDLS